MKILKKICIVFLFTVGNFSMPATPIPLNKAVSSAPVRATSGCPCTPSTCVSTPCTTPAVTFCCVDIGADQTISGALTVSCEIVNDLNVNGDVDVQGNLIVQGQANLLSDALIEQTLCVGQNATIFGNELLQGSLTVNNGATITGGSPNTVTVNGDEQINGSFTVTGNNQVNQDLTVGGNSILTGTLTVDATSTFNDQVLIEGNLQVLNDLTIGGNQFVSGTVTINGGAIINGANCVVIINGNLVIDNSLFISGSETIGQNLTVNGTSTFNGPLSTQDSLTITNGQTINNCGLNVSNGGATITGNVNITGINTTDDLNVLGDLSVFKDSILNTTVISGTLTDNGPVVMNNGLTISNGSETIASGNLTLTNGSLNMTGNTVLNGLVTALNGATTINGLTVNGVQTINTGNVTLVPCSNLDIAGNITVDQTISSPSPASFLSLTITDTTNSTSPDTGALVVDGGVGIALDLRLGGSEFFANVADQGGNPSPLNYYEEFCFTTTFSEGGAGSAPVTIQIIRIGKLVNLIIPFISIPGGDPGFTIKSNVLNPLPARFRPFVTVRGASSTITDVVTSALGEFEVTPQGIIIYGRSGGFLGPQPLGGGDSTVDIDTITYNLLSCGCPT